MTSHSVSAEQVVDEIRQVPHWQIRLTPPNLDGRIADPLACRQVVEQATVRMRGWDFPHLEEPGSTYGDSHPILRGYESWNRFRETEAWRMMQSGQFAYYATLAEDLEPESWRSSIGEVATKGPFLDLEATVYTFTEVVEFAARLTRLIDYDPGLTISMALHGAEGRRLVAGVRRALFREYISGVEAVPVEREAQPRELRESARDVAIDMAAELFQLFSFTTERRVLAEIQQNLVDRQFS